MDHSLAPCPPPLFGWLFKDQCTSGWRCVTWASFSCIITCLSLYEYQSCKSGTLYFVHRIQEWMTENLHGQWYIYLLFVLFVNSLTCNWVTHTCNNIWYNLTLCSHLDGQVNPGAGSLALISCIGTLVHNQLSDLCIKSCWGTSEAHGCPHPLHKH